MIKHLTSNYNIFKYLLLLSLIYTPVFGYLNTLPIRIWDEARLAINAYEMFKSNNFIVTTYLNDPDLWNTKPPLLIIFQALFMKLVGVNELAVRLPSAIAAFLTILSLVILLTRYLKTYWFAFITAIVLITSNGYINEHATRTGDYDAMLTLFTTVYCLLFFTYLETKNNKYLYLFFITLSLAVLTKSIAGLLFSPALFIYLIISKQFISLIKNKHFYIGLLIFIVSISGFYITREILSKGYLNAVYLNEYLGRFLYVNEGHHGSIWFYYDNIIKFKLNEIWYLLIPVGIIIGLFNKDSKHYKITLFSTIMAIMFFIVISSSETKIIWYDIPLYPFFSILIANAIYFVFDFLQNNKQINSKFKYNIMGFIFLFLILVEPYSYIVNKTYKPVEYAWDKRAFEISHFLKEAVKNKDKSLNNSILVYDGYYAHLRFYTNLLKDNDINVQIKTHTEVNVGDKIIVSQNNVKEYIESVFETKIIKEIYNIKIYEIIAKR